MYFGIILLYTVIDDCRLDSIKNDRKIMFTDQKYARGLPRSQLIWMNHLFTLNIHDWLSKDVYNPNQSTIWGPQKFLEFYPPQQLMFYCIFINKFSKLSKFGVLSPSIFSKNFPKFPKKFLKFFQVFQNRKKLLFLYPN